MSTNTQSEISISSLEGTLTFEEAMAELESIVGRMESGQLPLEQSLSAYKRGTELLQFCQKALADVEQQVRLLTEANQLQPFSVANE
ncbi:MAG TPA: exodeoxyribonuclease VII small subunit [Methylophilaceae bacterium]|nr:exodeoxyribonuclease VII small subunit [Methylophilaceae bacterium]